MTDDKAYAILDYDGFVCKAFYANKDDPMNMTAAAEILRDLEAAARDKTSKYFNTPTSSVHLIRVMSGHSWKKDIYPSYKRKRKKNEYLGMFREYVKKMPRVRLIEPLEADEVIVFLSDYLASQSYDNYIVFSDDKDLKYYCPAYCKINITEDISSQEYMEVYINQLHQMLIGDAQDNIKGIPGVGEKTAPRLLSNYEYSLKGVIKCFKDHNIDIDNCLRDLLLIIPLSRTYRLSDEQLESIIANDILAGSLPNDQLINRVIINQIKYLNEIVKEVYNG